ncbi:unnamed protein product [marine sediment metagenome]|uniref:Uncharacterized protein n=1 Tax=marine sediment metagenome TaxID=412755 RepID=X0TXG9_9ZZZZ
MKRPNITDYQYSDRTIYRRDLDKYIDYAESQNKELRDVKEKLVTHNLQLIEQISNLKIQKK